MANTKEIKDRIKSVRDTQKITNAMYLIASTKMRKAKSELDHTRPYFEAIKGEIKRIFRTSKKDAESRWFYPAVLKTLVPSYVSGYIYSALVDSFCAEQNARMTAMNSANQNAEKLLGELSVQYNRSRQAAITQEITEISSGAKAQKRKLAKKKSEEACGH